MILPDRSAWIDYLRDDDAAVERLDPLLGAKQVAMCGPVFAEIASGGGNRVAFDRLVRDFSRLPWLDEPAFAWRRVAEHRFVLARQGTAAHVVDLMIAVIALEAEAAILTRDRDFEAIGDALSVDVVIF